VAESLLSTLKLDLLHRHSWPTPRRRESAIFEDIEGFYNRERRPSTLGNLSAVTPTARRLFIVSPQLPDSQQKRW
jgi:transposase InsO family protein